MVNRLQLDEVLEDRDIDAALYLLTRILGVRDTDNTLREKLLEMKDRLEQDRAFQPNDKIDVVSAYREIIG
jgi:hypothetical protein